MTTPRCHNRPPVAEGRWLPTGRRVQTGTRAHPGAEPVWGPERPVLRWHPRWFEDRCTQWDGGGIGPKGEPYAAAHGFDCRGCRWLPPRGYREMHLKNWGDQIDKLLFNRLAAIVSPESVVESHQSKPFNALEAHARIEMEQAFRPYQSKVFKAP